MTALQLPEVENKIITIRDTPCILDSDVAILYGVETKRINEAVRNNPDKFPEGYVIFLDEIEWANLKSKNSTSSWGGVRKLPNAFTEKGLYMLATILKSPSATQTTIAIVETFTKFRELYRMVSEIPETEDKELQNTLMQKSGNIIADLLGSDLAVTDAETSIELNLALFKVKHTVKRKHAEQQE
ncbi:ORF6N domain-containing protein [Bacteroidales bacterium OttesenSCG-928-A14]|nr:ORF6N domain-containing protein [Bacteroidales bacterium OttesenSCG-928-A14]